MIYKSEQGEIVELTIANQFDGGVAMSSKYFLICRMLEVLIRVRYAVGHLVDRSQSDRLTTCQSNDVMSNPCGISEVRLNFSLELACLISRVV